MTEHAADDFETIAKRLAELRKERDAELAPVGADPAPKPVPTVEWYGG